MFGRKEQSIYAGQAQQEPKTIPLTPGLFKEIPFFKNEVVFLVVVSMVSFLLFALESIGFMAGGLFRGFLLMVGFAWGMYLIKWIFFMPRGQKVFIERNYPNAGVKVEIGKIPKDGLVQYDKKGGLPPVQVVRANKHHEFYTGRPWIKTIQGHSVNYSALDLAEGKMDKTGAEVADVWRMAYDTGYNTAADNARKSQEIFRNPVSIMSIGVLILSALTLIAVFAMYGQLEGMAETLIQIAESVGA